MTPDVQPSIAKSRPTRRRWFRFSLRSFFIFTTLVASLLFWVAKERQQSEFERQVGKKLQEQGWGVQLLGRYDSRTVGIYLQGWWRNLARQVLGKRIFLVSNGLLIDQKQVSLLVGLKNLEYLALHGYGRVSDITPLSGLKSLKELHISGILDNDLAPLSGLKNLEELELGYNSFGDLTPLAGLSKLKRLTLGGTSITELQPLADLKPLAGLKNLEELDVSGTSLIEEQVQSLKQALPNCKIIL